MFLSVVINASKAGYLDATEEGNCIRAALCFALIMLFCVVAQGSEDFSAREELLRVKRMLHKYAHACLDLCMRSCGLSCGV